MGWIPRLGERGLLTGLLRFWTGRDGRNQRKVFCNPVQEGERLGGSSACVPLCPVESQLEMHHFLHLLPSPKASGITGPYSCERFGTNGETELICVAWALFLNWNRSYFWGHFSGVTLMSDMLWWQLHEKRMNISSSMEGKQDKGCLCYIYILIAQPFCG